MRRMRKWARGSRIAVAWALVVLLTTDATMAGWLFCRPCRPVCCYPPCRVVYCCEPCPPCPPPCATVEGPSSHTMQRRAVETAPEKSQTESLPMPGAEDANRPMTEGSPRKDDFSALKQPDESSVVSGAAKPAMEPPKLESPPAAKTQIEPAKAEEPVAKAPAAESKPAAAPTDSSLDALFGPSTDETTKPAAEAKTPEAKTPEAPSAEATPAPEKPAADAEENLFGPTEAQAPSVPPADKPAAPADDPPKPADDLFGEPAVKADNAKTTDEAKPAASEPEKAAPADDLFGEPAAKADNAKATDEAKPAASEPEKAAPADDLFSPPTKQAPSEPAPSEPAAPKASANRPTLDAQTPPAKAPVEASPAKAPPAEAADDLFGPAENLPQPEPPKKAAEPADSDNLFGEPQASTGVRGGLSSPLMRQWVDNTGRFTTRGRLIKILDGKVRLLKDNGRTTTVPTERLSGADRRFVEVQTLAAEREKLLDRTVSR